MAMNTPNEDAQVTAGKDQKCAHPSCACLVPPDHPFGKYCSEHCDDAGEMDELRCECGHDACRGTEVTP
jgi:hypothetical protein